MNVTGVFHTLLSDNINNLLKYVLNLPKSARSHAIVACNILLFQYREGWLQLKYFYLYVSKLLVCELPKFSLFHEQ